EDDYENLKHDLLRVMAIDIPFKEEDVKKMRQDDQLEMVTAQAFETFKRKTERLAEIAHPVIKQVFENQGAMYENILIPITDGKRVYNISCSLKEAYETGSKALVKAFEKSILLHTIDEDWKEHLREMDELRHSVQNASYEQKDPLLIYKLESFNLFKTMVNDVNSKAVSILMRGQIPIQDPGSVRRAAPEQKTDYSKYRTQKEESESMPAAGSNGGRDPQQQRQPQKLEPIRVEKKVGRNDPCPCGSGKKYKNCHGA
ncbi:MAG: preprotein translocase subunit SecA, partial [Bacteroidales bacterium]|nr:preprotein translocase subunit SecA [Bacteroidales bacterium]